MFDTTVVFQANAASKADIVINQGGTSSSKTYSIMQLLFLKCCFEKRIIVTVTGESIPNLKKGAYRDAETIYAHNPWLKQFIVSWNKSDRTIVFKNGSIMEFTSNMDEQSAKNGKRNYLFVNEANGITWAVFLQLALRTKKSADGFGGQVFIDYNPSAPFWAHEKLIGTTPLNNDLSATVQCIISDHRHNRFLDADDHRKIEGIKDKELWKVYARGLTGNLTGLIYPGALRIPDEQFPWDQYFIGGLDFGYTNDPTAGVKIVKVGESIFLHELCYTPGISAINIKQIFTANGFGGDNPIYCDHDDDQIRQLRNLSMQAFRARKVPGSLRGGILKMKEFKIFYTASSTNLHDEKQKYMWIIDPATGKPTNTPIDQFNHLWDASRMGVYTHYFSAAA